ncbi:hypothetical protein R6Q59_001482 [Mikania micrantha]
MELKIMKRLEEEEEEITQPVSPIGQYFSIPPSVCIVAVFELENPIDDSEYAVVLKETMSRVNPRFSSIMVENENGEKHWKRVELKVEDHIKVPQFPDGLSLEDYDDYFAEYISSVGMDPFISSRPLWEVHVFKYPTSNAQGTIIFKVHHALGDGYSLMGVVLSCIQRAEDPSIPLTFPKLRLPPKSNNGLIKSIVNRVSHVFSCMLNTVFDLPVSIMKSSFLEDSENPIRSGEEGVEFRPIDVTTITFSLDEIKKIKSSLQVTLNDVISGVVFLGTRLYMESTISQSGNARSTSLVLLNIRSVDGYRSVEEMLHNSKAEHLWGNKFGFIQVSIPKLHELDHAFNPLKFVYEASASIKRIRNSWTMHLTGIMLECLRKYIGTQVAAKFLHRLQKNASMGLTSMIGPIEKMAICNQPIKGFYVMVFNVPQSYKVTIMSYMNQLRVVLGTEKGVIDPQKLKRCILEAYDMIFKAAF